jgi:hypothetical protein
MILRKEKRREDPTRSLPTYISVSITEVWRNYGGMDYFDIRKLYEIRVKYTG